MTSPRTERELCDYCQLPIPVAWWSRSRDETVTDRQFCCLGCRVAAQITREPGQSAQSRVLLTRLGIAIFLSMNVMVFTMALWSQDVYGLELGNATTAVLTELFRYISLLFAIPVLLLLGQPLLVNALEATRQGRPSIDLLLSIGIIAAFAYSTMTVFRGAGHTYFEVVCMVLVLVTLGRWIEATGRQKANSALDQLARLIPETVQKLTSNGLVTISRKEINTGDEVRVFPGERVPIDAEIIAGHCQLDLQVLTGESAPSNATVGETVCSGSLVLDNPLTLKVITQPGEDTLARMLEFVREARSLKGRYATLADRVATVFLPLVVVVAVGTVVWHGAHTGIEAALLNGLAVLLVSCPCALGLATPLAIWTSLNWAAEQQVLFRNGAALERLAKIRGICFDKTGTLTTGETQVDRILSSPICTHDEWLAWAKSLASYSSHPISRAVATIDLEQIHLSEPSDKQCGSSLQLFDVTQVAGRGLEGFEVESRRRVRLGSRQWLEDHDVAIPADIQQELDRQVGASSLVLIAIDQTVCGVISFREELRPEAKQVIQELKSSGIPVEVLSGDRIERAQQLEAVIEVPVRGESLPTEKSQRIEQLQREWGPVLMVGDGINDAPSLTSADVGLAMGCGTDLARDSADICLLRNDLSMIPVLLRLSTRTMTTIRWNLFWAFGYNIVGVALAASGQLNPIFAAILMFASSFFVITNSLRVARLDGISMRKLDTELQTTKSRSNGFRPDENGSEIKINQASVSNRDSIDVEHPGSRHSSHSAVR